MRAAALALSLIALGMPAMSSAQTLPNGKPLNHLVGGQFANDLDSIVHTGRLFTKFAWSGVYFETRVSGKSVSLWLDDPRNNFQLIVDGQVVDTIRKPNELIYTYDKLDKGEHVVRLEKISESQDGFGRFGGFYSNGKVSEYKRRTRQIEFVGDSYTVGYGNMSAGRTCSKEELVEYTNTSHAYGPMTAKSFNADYQINAFSGRGIVRNYDGFVGDPLPTLHPFSLFDGKTVSPGAGWWKPQVIVIGLGGNDFSTPVKPGEKWKDEAALKADYEQSFVAFVKTLRAKHPQAFFLLTKYEGPTVAEEVEKVATQLKASGETRLDTIGLDGFTLNGCDWHLDSNDHKRISEQLTGYFKAHPELWQGK